MLYGLGPSGIASVHGFHEGVEGSGQEMNNLIVQEPRKGYLVTRLRSLHEETHDANILPFISQADESGLQETQNDSLNTCLMENFKNFGNSIAFSLLYELNYKNFSVSIYNKIRKYYFLLDTSDILQEVFFNIYRYPYRFKADKPEAFRNWTHTIIRNTIIKHLKNQSRVGRVELAGEELSEKVDRTATTPLRGAMNQEGEKEVTRAFILYMYVYLAVYNRLSIKERKALFLVEVKGLSYKDASTEMEIKLENLKMVIFRARKKIFRSMRKSLAGCG